MYCRCCGAAIVVQVQTVIKPYIGLTVHTADTGEEVTKGGQGGTAHETTRWQARVPPRQLLVFRDVQGGQRGGEYLPEAMVWFDKCKSCCAHATPCFLVH